MAAERFAPSGHGSAAILRPRSPRPGREGLFLTPPAILIIGLLLTVAAVWIAHSTVVSRDRTRFRETVDEVAARIAERRRALALLVRSMSGLFALDDDVTPAEFKAYTGQLVLGETYAGVVSTGFALRTPDDQLGAVEERLRADYGSGVAVWSRGAGSEHYPVVLIEPHTDGNRRLLGLDLAGEPIRASVLARSAEVDGPVASPRLEYLADAAPESRVGYFIAAPVYRPDRPGAAGGADRGQLAGFVFAACRAHDLLGELVLPTPDRLYELTIYEGTAPAPGRVLYADTDARPAPRGPALRARRIVDVSHRPWTLEFASSPAFESSSSAWFVPVLAVAGVALTLAVSGAAFAGVRAGAAVKHLVARLVRSERTLKRIAESGVVGIAVFDRRWRLREANDAFLGLFGYTLDEVTGRGLSLDDLTQPSPGAAERRAAVHAGSVVGPFERECRRKDGTPITVLAGAAPLDSSRGDSIAFAVDITARKRAEQEVRRLNTTLESQVEQRTAELREVTEQLEAFARNVSHDLRAPLRAIEGFALMLLEQPAAGAGEVRRREAERIADAARRMERMIVGLLECSRLARSEMRLGPVPVATAVADALAAEDAVLRDAGASVEVAPGMPVVRAHRAALAQALGNLVGNAAKFVAAGEPARIVIRWEPADGRARIIVEDNGIGLPRDPAERERIFRPFARLHSRDSYEGTGLGLAIAKAGIERMGGRIGVEDNVPRGARFWVELPLAGAGRGAGAADGRREEQAA